jgi:hypothetical protein
LAELAGDDCEVVARLDAIPPGSLSRDWETVVAPIGVRALVAAAEGDDDVARDVLDAALAVDPLDDPSGWRRSARWLPLAYVLLPAVREQLDRLHVGPIHARRLEVARAVAAASAEPAVRHAQRALAADEWYEPAYRTLIAAALARGDGPGAARILGECDAMLAGLGVAAGEQTEMLRRRLTAQQRLSA